MRSSEDPEYIIPKNLHHTTVNKILKILRNTQFKLEVWFENGAFTELITDRKDPAFNTCTLLEYEKPFSISAGDDSLSFKGKKQVSIPHNRKIEYICLINKILMYQLCLK